MWMLGDCKGLLQVFHDNSGLSKTSRLPRWIHRIVTLSKNPRMERTFPNTIIYRHIPYFISNFPTKMKLWYIDIGSFPTQLETLSFFYMICSKLLPVKRGGIFPVQNSTSWGRWIEPFLGAYLAIFALIRLRVLGFFVGLDGWEIPGTKYGKQRIDVRVIVVYVYCLTFWVYFW